MKIGILTQVGSNYGCILQMYALQTFLQSRGCEVVVLNRHFAYPSIYLYVLRLMSLIKGFIKYIFLNDDEFVYCSPLNNNFTVKKSYKIDDSNLADFMGNYINLSPQIRYTHSLRRYVRSNNFDAVIVGSDQVWREAYSPDIYNYFLDFLADDEQTMRISYAASFGSLDSPISNKKIRKCIELAHKFNAISVREDSAVQFMANRFNISAEHVIDPTLLLTVSNYIELIDESDREFGKGKVVSYFLDNTIDKERIADDISSHTAHDLMSLMEMPKNKDGVKKMPSLSRWLASFYNAHFIVTDSFHGCVFSILFNKPFIVIANYQRGIDRFVSLLKMFSLYDRLIFSYDEYKAKFSMLILPIDFSIVDAQVERQRGIAISFMQRNGIIK